MNLKNTVLVTICLSLDNFAFEASQPLSQLLLQKGSGTLCEKQCSALMRKGIKVRKPNPKKRAVKETTRKAKVAKVATRKVAKKARKKSSL